MAQQAAQQRQTKNQRDAVLSTGTGLDWRQRCQRKQQQPLPSPLTHLCRLIAALQVFAPDTTQERLYSTAVASIVEEVLEGFNCTIFAYGQTGTGKTHTMTGDIELAPAGGELGAGAGVIPRAIHQIFAYLDGIASEYSVKCSYLELYNEEITDLLTVGADVPKVRCMALWSLQGLRWGCWVVGLAMPAA